MTARVHSGAAGPRGAGSRATGARTLLVAVLLLAACRKPEPEPDPHAGHEMPAAPAADPHAGHDADPAAAGEIEVSAAAVEALGFRTAPAREGAASTVHRAPATVGYDPLETTRLTAQSGGQVRALALPRPGEPVRRGTIVARLYEPTVIAAFEELLVARDLGGSWLEAARARLHNMGVHHLDVEAALADGVAPATYVLRSPVDAVVVERTATEGAWIAARGLVAVLADPAAIVADAVVQGVAPEEGASVTLRDPATDQTWPARVASRLPTADAAGVQIRIVPEGEAPPVGRPLVAEWREGAGEGVWVPRSAVVDTGERRVVFVELAPGRYEPRSVRLGARTTDEIQVLEGIDPGEPVVVSGTFLLDSETQIGGMGHAGHGG